MTYAKAMRIAAQNCAEKEMKALATASLLRSARKKTQKHQEARVWHNACLWHRQQAERAEKRH